MVQCACRNLLSAAALCSLVGFGFQCIKFRNVQLFSSRHGVTVLVNVTFGLSISQITYEAGFASHCVRFCSCGDSSGLQAQLKAVLEAFIILILLTEGVVEITMLCYRIMLSLNHLETKSISSHWSLVSAQNSAPQTLAAVFPNAHKQSFSQRCELAT